MVFEILFCNASEEIITLGFKGGTFSFVLFVFDLFKSVRFKQSQFFVTESAYRVVICRNFNIFHTIYVALKNFQNYPMFICVHVCVFVIVGSGTKSGKTLEDKEKTNRSSAQ